MRFKTQRISRIARRTGGLDVDDFLAGRDGICGVWEAFFLEVGPLVVCLAAGEDSVQEGRREGGGGEESGEEEGCKLHCEVGRVATWI